VKFHPININRAKLAMGDFLSPQERSVRMAAVRRKDTAPEIALRKVLHRRGLRFRLHVKTLPGTPDIVFPKYHAIVFVHGCFWHRHRECKLATTPKNNQRFWDEKFQKNILRDIATTKILESLGWRVYVVWLCETSSHAKAEESGLRVARKVMQTFDYTSKNHVRGIR